MSVKFNAAEILDMAIRIEQNGARYYRKAAEQFDDDRMVKLLNELASWEDGHKLTFTAIKEDLLSSDAESVVFDPQVEVPLYLNAMADGNIFNVEEDPAKKLTGEETAEQVLRTALLMEKDSVVFYLGLRELVPPSLGRDKVEKIISEEMGHIGYINRELSAIKSK